ncbi:MAG: hypothetical protein ABIN48_03485 [Ginsengibacter sp.]
MKKIIIITILFGTTHLFAQQQQDFKLLEEVPVLKENVSQQRQQIDLLIKSLKNQENLVGKQTQSIEALQIKNNDLNASIDSLKLLTQINSQNIISNSNELGTKLKKTDEPVNSNNSKIAELGSSLSKNQLYWIIVTLIILLLGGLVYWILGKRIQSSKTDVEAQIKNTKIALEEEGVKLDNNLVEVLETQLKLQQEALQSQSSISNEKTDHSLALKVADEIVRMKKNISKIDGDIKGLKPLEKGIERIQANFAANGYEIVNLLNTDYDERMNIDVINFIKNNILESEKRIVSRIIKPQVNFNGILIQRAQVEVSQN